MDRIPHSIAAPMPRVIPRKLIILAAIVVAVAVLFVADSYWPSTGPMHKTIEWVGRALIVVCILGRTWCTLYIGGRKSTSLVTEGPYSVSRNPLYVFSIIGAIGVGAQFGGVTTALLCGFFVWAVFLWLVWNEEAKLTALHEDYRGYMERVPRFWPRFALWHSASTLLVQPRNTLYTFLDGLVFLAAIPLMEFFEYLHYTGALPVYFTLP